MQPLTYNAEHAAPLSLCSDPTIMPPCVRSHLLKVTANLAGPNRPTAGDMRSWGKKLPTKTSVARKPVLRARRVIASACMPPWRDVGRARCYQSWQSIVSCRAHVRHDLRTPAALEEQARELARRNVGIVKREIRGSVRIDSLQQQHKPVGAVTIQVIPV